MSTQNSTSYNPLQVNIEPEFLDIEEESHLLDRAMQKMGTTYLYAGVAGGISGVFTGFRAGEKGSAKLRLNPIINHVTTRSIKTANYFTCGSLVFQLIEISINLVREIDDDAYSSIGAGFLTGGLYSFFTKARNPLIRWGFTPLIGTTLASAWSYYFNPNFKKSFMEKYNNFFPKENKNE